MKCGEPNWFACLHWKTEGWFKRHFPPRKCNFKIRKKPSYSFSVSEFSHCKGKTCSFAHSLHLSCFRSTGQRQKKKQKLRSRHRVWSWLFHFFAFFFHITRRKNKRWYFRSYRKLACQFVFLPSEWYHVFLNKNNSWKISNKSLSVFFHEMCVYWAA